MENFVCLVFIVWTITLCLYIRFRFMVVPAALRRWAEIHDFRIVETRRRPFFSANDPFSRIFGSNHQIVRLLTLQDEAGRLRDCWVLIGNYWYPSLTLERCPIEAFWDAPGPSKPIRVETRPERPPLWDRDMDT